MALPLTVEGWPPPPVHTDRLVLRPPSATDRGAFLDLATDAEVNRFLGGPRDREEMSRTLPDVPADQPGQLVVEHDGLFLGWIGLSRRDPGRPGTSPVDGPPLELSYLFQAGAWGHGYARESCAAFLAWADERLGEPVVLCTQIANTRSVALAGRLGFREVERFEEFGAEQWFGVRHPAVRRAGAHDVPALQRIAEAAYTPYVARMGGLRPGPLETDYATAVADSEAWVAVGGEDVVGFLLLVPEADTMLLENVAVAPSHQGRGLGRALLELAESRTRAHGLHRVRLYTHETMVENQRLYSFIGFVETHRATEHGFTRVFFEKWLA